MKGFWRDEEHEFEQEKFLEFLDVLILRKMETIMADVTKLQADVDAQAPLIAALKSKVDAQAAQITDLEAKLAAAADPQAPIDAIDATVVSNNEALTAAGG